MTNREFYVNVLDLIDVIESDDPTGCVDTKVMAEKAHELITSLDARNEKRKSTESKEKKETAERRDAVLEFLKTHEGAWTRDQISFEIGMDPAKVTGACTILIKSGLVVKSEVKVEKSRKVAYSIA